LSEKTAESIIKAIAVIEIRLFFIVYLMIYLKIYYLKYATSNKFSAINNL